LIAIFISVYCLADSYQQEEHDGDDEIKGVDVFVKRQNPKIVKIPEEMENNHEDNGESSEDV